MYEDKIYISSSVYLLFTQDLNIELLTRLVVLKQKFVMAAFMNKKHTVAAFS